MNEKNEIAGYDIQAVESWISENTQGLTGPFSWTRLEGGHSNLTYALLDAHGQQAVVRRPPLGELLPKAHDMGREFSIISGLGGTKVPVPIAYGYCQDSTVTGAHFYVMSQVEGRALFESEDAEEYLTVDPDFVYIIVLVLFLLYSSFGLVQLHEVLCGLDPYKKEKTYVILSLTAKLVLGWMIFSNVLLLS